MTVDFDLRLVNENDPFVRIFGIWVDSPPPQGWTIDLARQNTAAFRKNVQDGDSVSGSLSLSDGKHDLYLAISQTISERLGFWTVEGKLNSVAVQPLERLDHDTVGRYSITVKDGVVVSTQDDPELEELREITGLKALTSAKEAILAAKDKIVEKSGEVKVLVEENKKESMIISAISVGVAAAVGLFSIKRKERRF